MDDPAEAAASADAAALFERALEAIRADDLLRRRGRFLSTDCLIGIGTVPFHLSIRDGRIAADRGPRLMRPWTFAIRGAAATWLKFWRPVPEPGWHDLFALTKRGAATIEGDLRPLMANLQFMKDVLARPRYLA
jgi:hypothetical protein